MAQYYLPILKAKAGEFEALSNIEEEQAKKMLPLFEVCRIGDGVRNAARFKNSRALTCDYLDEVADRIAEVWKGKSALIDAFQWPANSITETGEHILPHLYSKLRMLGVNALPVVGYDRWDSQPYKLALQGLEVAKDGYYCLRLDSHAIEDSADPEFFTKTVLQILNDMGIEPERCAVLIDFGDITTVSLEKLVEQASAVINQLRELGFRFFATAGCSLPPSIDIAVKKQNSTAKIVRKEMLLWQTLKSEYMGLTWLFGDYGVRGPNAADDIISTNTNGKIRYTINQYYYIVRGHSVQTGDKGAQMYKLAKTVVESTYYLKDNFSWGDARILACSQGEFKGNSKNWIAIDTNHHIIYVVAEVEEFEIRVLTSV